MMRLARPAKGGADRREFAVHNVGEVRDDEDHCADDQTEQNDVLRHRRASLVFPKFVDEFPNFRHDITPYSLFFDDECV
jgi:hypothetical protein